MFGFFLGTFMCCGVFAYLMLRVAPMMADGSLQGAFEQVAKLF